MPASPVHVPPVPAHWLLPADPASVPRARRAVTEALPAGCRPQLRDDLRLLASELVTNAVRHHSCADRGQLVELVLWPADGHYWVAVSDGGPALSLAPADPGPDSCGGRGLLLVDAVSAAWAVVPRPARGKSVVAGIRLGRHTS
ncbi:ATP-binding protein [Streptomyces sp. YIM 98790]|uniref:ATP-binding protein n=1 Tax=Streptomyces sp. YIM 98790 TaxID=2689077 RepID=UPI00140C6F8B|nr:ATP-binding protein [Streptomyces sp. YIM 98790]